MVRMDRLEAYATFRPWRVATVPWRCFPRDLHSLLDAQESTVA
jgi:hypothetical protein